MYDYTKNIRVKKEEYDQAEKIVNALNMNMSGVFNLLIKQIIVQEGIPFHISLKKIESSTVGSNFFEGKEEFANLNGTDDLSLEMGNLDLDSMDLDDVDLSTVFDD